MMLFNKFNKRSEVRYPIRWETELIVQYSDHTVLLKVTVINISLQGAMLLSDHMFINGQPIISNHPKTQLSLILQVSGIRMQIPVEVRWYQWSVENNQYEIGVKFSELRDTVRKEIHALIQTVRQSPMISGNPDEIRGIGKFSFGVHLICMIGKILS